MFQALSSMSLSAPQNIDSQNPSREREHSWADSSIIVSSQTQYSHHPLFQQQYSPRPGASHIGSTYKESQVEVVQHTHPLLTSAFNPFIYGNDVDSVDIATRVAMVIAKEKKHIKLQILITILNLLFC